MTGTVAIVVAVIAAIASIGAATASWASAKRADTTARAVAGLGHRIAGVERQLESFRADYAAFLRNVGDAATQAEMGPIRNLGPVLTVGDILRSHALATDALDTAIEEVCLKLTLIAIVDRNFILDEELKAVREEVRSILRTVEQRREELIATREAVTQ